MTLTLSTAQILVLGAAAGLPIFVGLPMGRMHWLDARVKCFLSSIGSTASLSTSQSKKIKMPVAVAARNAFVAGVTFRIRATGRPRKMVNPAIAPSSRIWAVLM